MLISAYLTVAAVPVFAQDTLPYPVKPLDQPISMSYRDLETVSLEGNLTFSLFKQGQKTQTQSLDFQGTMSSHTVGNDLELSFEGRLGTSQTQRVRCLMRRTGVVLKCAPEATFRFPFYDREAYKSGYTLTIPFATIDGIGRVLNGKVRGTSIIGSRQLMVVDFADHRAERTGAIDVVLDVTGYAYVDIATGYPVELDASAEIVGAFSDFDRLQMHMKQEYTFSSVQ
jgi:hypothetical protein